MKHTNKYRYRPRVDVLEDRQLLAAQLTASLAAGILRVEGTEGADNIAVRQENGLISVVGVRILVEATQTTVPSVAASSVSRVEVLALGGGDEVSLASLTKTHPPLTVNAYVSGGAGNDTIFGGTGNDELAGQDGNDQVHGFSGNDTLSGGTGMNALDGGAGGDTVAESGDATWILSDTSVADNGSSTSALAGIEYANLTGGAGDNLLHAAAFSGAVTLSGGAGHDTLLGPASNTGHVLLGGDGDDLLVGGGGFDWLEGGTGNDVLVHAAGSNTLDGGDGIDRVEATGDANWTLTTVTLTGLGTSTLVGIEQAILAGGAGHNALDATGFTGPVTLYGGAGNDTLRAGAGNDVLDGGLGNDTLDGGAGTDRVQGAGDVNWSLSNTKLIGQGSDNLAGIEQAEITGGVGKNSLDALNFTGPVTLHGGDGDDTLRGGASNDILLGGFGNDLLWHEAGLDWLDGGAGLDRVVASGGGNWKLSNTNLTGQGSSSLVSIEEALLVGSTDANKYDAQAFSGAVTVNAGGGDDTVYGGSGADSLLGGSGDDYVSGGAGADTLDGSDGFDTLFGGEGNDSLEGGDNNDTLYGSLGNDTLKGEDGNDWMEGGGDSDTLEGGNGQDHLSAADYSWYEDGVGNLLLGGPGNDTLDGSTGNDTMHGEAGNDSLWGANGNDTLTGGDNDDVVRGGHGLDYVAGNAGADRLDGGADNDYLDGGSGADVVNGGAGVNTYAASVTPGFRILYLQFDGAAMTNADLRSWAKYNATGTTKEWDVEGTQGDEGVDFNRDGVKVDPFLANDWNREVVIDEAMRHIWEDFRVFDVDIVRRNAGELAVINQRATTVFIGPAVIDGYQGKGLRGIAGEVDDDLTGNNNNINSTDVAFVIDLHGDTQARQAQFVANTAAHEAAHTYGLSHVFGEKRNELMRSGGQATWDQNAGNNYAFLDRDFTGGPAGHQNSYRELMLTLLGNANPPPGPQGFEVPSDPDEEPHLTGGGATSDGHDHAHHAEAELVVAPVAVVPARAGTVDVPMTPATAPNEPVRAAVLDRAGDVVENVSRAAVTAPEVWQAPPADATPWWAHGEHGPELMGDLLLRDVALMDRVFARS